MQNKEEIFSALITRDLGMLRSAAYRILGDQTEVDDAVQEALLVAWNKYSQFRAEAEFSSWVYRITINQCCDRLRKRKREAAKLKAYAENKALDPAPDANEQLDRLMEAIAELPGIYRDSIFVGVLGGFPAEQAAGILQCCVNTLYQRIHKAKKLLRKKLEVAI